MKHHTMDLDQRENQVYPFLFRNRTNAWIFLHSNDGRSIILPTIMETGYG